MKNQDDWVCYTCTSQHKTERRDSLPCMQLASQPAKQPASKPPFIDTQHSARYTDNIPPASQPVRLRLLTHNIPLTIQTTFRWPASQPASLPAMASQRASVY